MKRHQFLIWQVFVPKYYACRELLHHGDNLLIVNMKYLCCFNNYRLATSIMTTKTRRIQKYWSRSSGDEVRSICEVPILLACLNMSIQLCLSPVVIPWRGAWSDMKFVSKVLITWSTSLWSPWLRLLFFGCFYLSVFLSKIISTCMGTIRWDPVKFQRDSTRT